MAATTLDTFLARRGIIEVDVLEVDANGMDALVLEGAAPGCTQSPKATGHAAPKGRRAAAPPRSRRAAGLQRRAALAHPTSNGRAAGPHHCRRWG